MGLWQTSSENTSSLHDELNHPWTSSSFWLLVGIAQELCVVVGNTVSMPSKKRNPSMGKYTTSSCFCFFCPGCLMDGKWKTRVKKLLEEAIGPCLSTWMGPASAEAWFATQFALKAATNWFA